MTRTRQLSTSTVPAVKLSSAMSGTHRGMHHKVGAEGFAVPCGVRVCTRNHSSARSIAVTALSVRTSMPMSRKSFHQPFDQLCIELVQHPRAALEHRHVCTRAGRNVRELRGNVTAADHHDPLGQSLKLHEFIAGDGVLRTWKVERDRASSNHDVTAFEHAAIYLDRVRTRE